MIKDLLKLADSLDRLGFHKEADRLSAIAKIKIAAPSGASNAAAGAALGLGVPATLGTAGGIGAGAALATPVSSATGAIGGAALGTETMVAGAAATAGLSAAVLGGALLGYGVGTMINNQLDKSGANDAVIKWLLQPSLKNGIKYKIAIDKTAIDPSLLKGAVSFVPYGVSGILMKGNQIVNKNSNATFPVTSPVGIAQGTEVTLPQNQNGILIPTSVSVSIIYSNGSRRNAVSTPESTIFTAGSNVVVASIKTVAKTAR